MGVINITPDSFSDGGLFGQVNWQQQLESWRQHHCYLFDIGAQSTAPFNDSIGIEQEWRRIEESFFTQKLLRALKKGDSLSLDSYRPQVFDRFCRRLKTEQIKSDQLIFNDVSGVLDCDLKELLLTYPDVYYVFSHCHAPSREETNQHMNFVIDLDDENQFYQHFIDYFEKGIDQLISWGVDPSRIILDPGFGFSKSFEQNLLLLSKLKDLFQHFTHSWLIGLSKKSFLQKLQTSDSSNEVDRKEESEKLHSAFLSLLTLQFNDIRKSDQRLIFRLHDPKIFYQSQIALQILEGRYHQL